ncbi:MAG: hypothetical protein ABIT07_01740 [Ferruginibacter sp.]
MGMEDDTRGFLILIVNTIATVLIWMIANVLVGIYFNLAFFEDRPGWKNVVYYLGFLVSLFLLIRYLRRKWKF